jgi:hypothetical protein
MDIFRKVESIQKRQKNFNNLIGKKTTRLNASQYFPRETLVLFHLEKLDLACHGMRANASNR